MSHRIFGLILSLWISLSAFSLDKPIFEVSADFDYPPYSYFDNKGRPSGMDIEILEELEQFLDVNFSYNLVKWDSALHDVKTGETDIITGIIFSESREVAFDFTIPMHTTYYSIFAAKNLKFKNVADLKGKKIVILPGDISINGYIKPMGLFENYSYAKSLPDAIMRIESGMYDYVIAPYSLGMEIISNMRCKNVEVKGPPIMPSMYCLAVKKGNIQLLSQLNKGIEQLRASGKLEQIQDKWIRFSRKEQNYKQWMKYTLFALAGLLFLFVLVVTWWFALKKEVHKKTTEIKESEEKYSHIFNSARDALVLFNRKGEIVDANAEALSMFGYSNNEIRLLKINDILPDNTQTLKTYCSAGDNMQHFFEEFTASNKNGETFFINLKATVFLLHGSFHVLSIIRDISMEKKNEKALMDAKTAAEKANLAKSDFVSHVSHEIRTPLNAIEGFTYLLKNRTTLDEDQERFVHMLSSSGQTLKQIINEILDNAKIESGKVEIDEHPFTMATIFEEIFNMMSVQCEQKELQLKLENQVNENLVLIGDSLKLKQILINLCYNAIKFTPTGEITLHASEIDQSHDNSTVSVSFYVKDTGIGLSHEEKNRIFQPYDQADASVSRKYGGTGLGLSICQNLVRLMGSDIQVESESGQGSKFYFTMTFRRSDDTSYLSLSDQYDPNIKNPTGKG